MNQPTFGNNAAPPAAFAGMDGAVADDNAPKLTEGNHVVAIRCLKLFVGNYGLTFAAEMEIVSTAGNPMHEAGQAVAYTRTGLDDARPVDRNRNMGQVKSFFAALFGMDPAQPPGPGQTWDQVMNEAISGEGTACAGMQVSTVAVPKVSKAGNAYTKHAWAPVVG